MRARGAAGRIAACHPANRRPTCSICSTPTSLPCSSASTRPSASRPSATPSPRRAAPPPPPRAPRTPRPGPSRPRRAAPPSSPVPAAPEMSSLALAHLTLEAAAGGEDACRPLVALLATRLHSIARGYRLSEADADDVVQITWGRALLHLDR